LLDCRFIQRRAGHQINARLMETLGEDGKLVSSDGVSTDGDEWQWMNGFRQR
jgi:hypothetical protein